MSAGYLPTVPMDDQHTETMAKPSPIAPEKQTLPLGVFLARMDEQEAEYARTAATRMDELERQIAHFDDVDVRYAKYSLWALIPFTIGALTAFVRSEPFGTIYSLIGPMGVVALICGLPAVGLTYALKVRDRTTADQQMLELNRQYFVPYGGYYFPGIGGSGTGRVIEIDEPAPFYRRYSRYDHIRPGRLW